jgi:lipopolysaccharide/colanic/teichoic acid biosynthesis glycosyltransferase
VSTLSHLSQTTSNSGELSPSTETIDLGEVSARDTYRRLKRAADIIVSSGLMIALAPLSIIIALLIKLDSPGPILYVTRAVGFEGGDFPLLKFRSMHPTVDAAMEMQDLQMNVNGGIPTMVKDGKPIYKTALADQKRITRFGRLLRKSSLDELPQLWNIFWGDMSLVGPRPALPREVALYEQWQMQRFVVKPGLTGLYQVSARNHVPVDEMIRIDLQYIRSQSFWADLQIILRTPFAMFRGL